jgi:hypothetical protein
LHAGQQHAGFGHHGTPRFQQQFQTALFRQPAELRNQGADIRPRLVPIRHAETAAEVYLLKSDAVFT